MFDIHIQDKNWIEVYNVNNTYLIENVIQVGEYSYELEYYFYENNYCICKYEDGNSHAVFVSKDKSHLLITEKRFRCYFICTVIDTNTGHIGVKDINIDKLYYEYDSIDLYKIRNRGVNSD